MNELTHTLGIRAISAGAVSSQALHVFLYLGSFGVILSNSGQVICHTSALQSKDVWNTKLTLRYMQRHAQTYHFSS